jgi:hypothetical protein
MMIQNKLICPKCHTRNLRKAHGKNPIGEMFCDKDHEYFTIWELVHKWGYDAGDFVNLNGVSLLPNKPKCPHTDLQDYPSDVSEEYLGRKYCKNCLESFTIDTPIDILTDWQEGEIPPPTSDEVILESEKERKESYEMVNRMFLGIPEWDDYQDLKNTERDALGRMF